MLQQSNIGQRNRKWPRQSHLGTISVAAPTCADDILILANSECEQSIMDIIYHHQGRIQDLWLGGAWVGEGSGDRLRSPVGQGQSPGSGPRGAKPPGSSGGLRNYRHLFERQFWTNHTIFIKPKKLDFES